MKSLYWVVFFVCLTQCNSIAQTTFNHRYHFDYLYATLSSLHITDSCYYATGTIADTTGKQNVLFSKFDLEGQPIFTKVWSHPHKQTFSLEPALVPTSDGNLMMAGLAIDSIRRTLLIKFQPDGDTIFVKEYLSPYAPQNTFTYVTGLCETSDGGYLLVNNVGNMSPALNSHISLLRVGQNGDLVWHKTYGNHLSEVSSCLIPDGQGGFVIGANQSDVNLVTEDYLMTTWIFQVNNDGEIIWEYFSPSDIQRDEARDMILTEEGELVIASGVGYEQERSSLNVIYYEKLVSKIILGGDLQWEREFKAHHLTKRVRSEKVLILTDNTGFILAGMEPQPYFATDEKWYVQGWLGKVSNEGDSLWTRSYVYLENQQNRHQILDMKETPDGGILLCGASNNRDLASDSIPYRAWLFKVDEYGCLVPDCHLVSTEEAPKTILHFSLYPNPAMDYLNIWLHSPTFKVNSHPTLQIINANGQVLRQFPVVGNDVTSIVSVADYPTGVYYLQYLEEGIVIETKQFVISGSKK